MFTLYIFSKPFEGKLHTSLPLEGMTKWSKFFRREEWRLFHLQEKARVVVEILTVGVSVIGA